MNSIKLTPIWMFILLLAILILSVIIGAQVSEGFTSKTSDYLNTEVDGYLNKKLRPLVQSSIHYDNVNGNMVLQTGTNVEIGRASCRERVLLIV